jgi:hypothetical protein
MTPGFSGPDLLGDYADVESPVVVMDPAANYTQAPSPLYLRGRQKDSAQDIVSGWTPAITVWLQRSFADLCIGRRIVVDRVAGTNTCYWIDEDGHSVSPPVSYWGNHPIWGGMLPQKYTDPKGLFSHDVVFIPPFYVKGATPVDTDTQRIHDVWIKPDPFKAGGYIHPMFRTAPQGMLVSACLLTNDASRAKSIIGTAGSTSSPANWQNYIGALNNTGEDTVLPLDFHTLAGLMLLCGIEHGAIDASTFSVSPSSVSNNGASNVYRGLYSFVVARVGSDANLFCPGLQYGARSGSPVSVYISMPGSPSSRVSIGATAAPISGSQPTGIYTGYNDALGVDLEIYTFGKDYIAQDTPGPYSMRFVSGSAAVTDGVALAYSQPSLGLGLGAVISPNLIIY